MKRTISLILAALMLVASLCTLIACDGDNGGGGGEQPSAKTYKVTVVDDSDAPVSGAKVKLLNAETGKLAKILTTDASGVATYTPDEGVAVKAQLFQAEDYIFDATKTYDFPENGELKISIEKKTTLKETYTVYVVDADGNAVEGAYVHICRKGDTEICLSGMYTDAEGKVSYEVDAGYEWKAKFVEDTVYTEFGDAKEVTLVAE